MSQSLHQQTVEDRKEHFYCNGKQGEPSVKRLDKQEYGQKQYQKISLKEHQITSSSSQTDFHHTNNNLKRLKEFSNLQNGTINLSIKDNVHNTATVNSPQITKQQKASNQKKLLNEDEGQQQQIVLNRPFQKNYKNLQKKIQKQITSTVYSSNQQTSKQSLKNKQKQQKDKKLQQNTTKNRNIQQDLSQSCMTLRSDPSEEGSNDEQIKQNQEIFQSVLEYENQQDDINIQPKSHNHNELELQNEQKLNGKSEHESKNIQFEQQQEQETFLYLKNQHGSTFLQNLGKSNDTQLDSHLPPKIKSSSTVIKKLQTNQPKLNSNKVQQKSFSSQPVNKNDKPLIKNQMNKQIKKQSKRQEKQVKSVKSHSQYIYEQRKDNKDIKTKSSRQLPQKDRSTFQIKDRQTSQIKIDVIKKKNIPQIYLQTQRLEEQQRMRRQRKYGNHQSSHSPYKPSIYRHIESNNYQQQEYYPNQFYTNYQHPNNQPKVQYQQDVNYMQYKEDQMYRRSYNSDNHHHPSMSPFYRPPTQPYLNTHPLEKQYSKFDKKRNHQRDAYNNREHRHQKFTYEKRSKNFPPDYQIINGWRVPSRGNIVYDPKNRPWINQYKPSVEEAYYENLRKKQYLTLYQNQALQQYQYERTAKQKYYNRKQSYNVSQSNQYYPFPINYHYQPQYTGYSQINVKESLKQKITTSERNQKDYAFKKEQISKNQHIPRNNQGFRTIQQTEKQRVPRADRISNLKVNPQQITRKAQQKRVINPNIKLYPVNNYKDLPKERKVLPADILSNKQQQVKPFALVKQLLKPSHDHQVFVIYDIPVVISKQDIKTLSADIFLLPYCRAVYLNNCPTKWLKYLEKVTGLNLIKSIEEMNKKFENQNGRDISQGHVNRMLISCRNKEKKINFSSLYLMKLTTLIDEQSRNPYGKTLFRQSILKAIAKMTENIINNASNKEIQRTMLIHGGFFPGVNRAQTPTLLTNNLSLGLGRSSRQCSKSDRKIGRIIINVPKQQEYQQYIKQMTKIMHTYRNNKNK